MTGKRILYYVTAIKIKIIVISFPTIRPGSPLMDIIKQNLSILYEVFLSISFFQSFATVWGPSVGHVISVLSTALYKIFYWLNFNLCYDLFLDFFYGQTECNLLFVS